MVGMHDTRPSTAAIREGLLTEFVDDGEVAHLSLMLRHLVI